MKRPFQIALLFASTCFTVQAADIPPIKRQLPPEGIEIPADVRERLEKRLAATKQRLEQVDDRKLKPDIEIFTKAVELALLHREFYTPKDFDKADWALDEANKRLDELFDGTPRWTEATGLVVRGYRSDIDGSAQAFGLVIPKDHDFSKPCPLYVWLHGRGDKNTDLHFLYERATKVGQIAPPGAIVLHPFGRHCVGWKHAGEIDVLYAYSRVRKTYNIDRHRIVLMGFSMGGAGAWHVGAHSAMDFVAISPGAGFAETARYQRLTPDRYPPWYEQKLWGQYDTPCYVRNLFNTEVIAYSGELDRQIQAARVMEEAYKAEGRELTHLIGPGVEHKYEPMTLEEIMRRIASAVERGQDKVPRQVHLQTRTMTYPLVHWIRIDGLEEHWEDSRVDAEIVAEKHARVVTKNITGIRVTPWPFDEMKDAKIELDGQMFEGQGREFRKENGRWMRGIIDQSAKRKRYGLCGPIDDAFMRPFIVVTPSGKSRNDHFQKWMEFELQHFRDRWRALMRGEFHEMRDVDFVELDPASSTNYFFNIILWGDPDSNVAIRELVYDLPVNWHDTKWQFGTSTYDRDKFAPVMVFPRRVGSRDSYLNYFVLNSGLTFREGHDRTNSQQNAKLPDWAIIDITQPPDAFAPGRIHDAGFFDEEWKLKSQPKGP